MSILLEIGAGISIAKAAFGIIGSGIAAASKADELKTQYNNQLVKLEKQKTYLTDKYNNEVNLSNWDWDTTRNQTGINLGQVKENQALNANVSAMQNVTNNKRISQNLAYTIENAKAQGAQITQQASTSGFRNSVGTSINRNVNNSKKSVNDAIELEQESAKVSTAASYIQARANYLNSDYTFNQYINNLKNSEYQYQWNTKQRRENFDYNNSLIDFATGEIKSAKDSVNFWSLWLGGGGAEKIGNNVNDILSNLDTIIEKKY